MAVDQNGTLDWQIRLRRSNFYENEKYGKKLRVKSIEKFEQEHVE